MTIWIIRHTHSRPVKNTAPAKINVTDFPLDLLIFDFMIFQAQEDCLQIKTWGFREEAVTWFFFLKPKNCFLFSQYWVSIFGKLFAFLFFSQTFLSRTFQDNQEDWAKNNFVCESSPPQEEKSYLLLCNQWQVNLLLLQQISQLDPWIIHFEDAPTLHNNFLHCFAKEWLTIIEQDKKKKKKKKRKKETDGIIC